MHLGSRHSPLAALLLVPALLTLTGCPGLTMKAQTLNTSRGEVKAVLGDPDSFPRFCVNDSTKALRESDVDPASDLIVVRRGDHSCAFLVDQMAFHHVAQGTLGEQPFVLMYCVVCDVAIGLTPVLDGQLLHMSAGGLSNGVVLARDDETGTYWDVTGEAVAGPLTGKHLEAWPIERTNAKAALADEPSLPLARSNMGPYGTWWSRCVTLLTRDQDGYMPFYFRKTLGPGDPRCGELELGLGVVIDGHARFYPSSELSTLGDDMVRDRLASDEVTLVKSHDGTTWSASEADGKQPFQVWGRWYGFSGTFRDCDVFATDSSAIAARVGTPAPQPALAAAELAPIAER